MGLSSVLERKEATLTKDMEVAGVPVNFEGFMAEVTHIKPKDSEWQNVIAFAKRRQMHNMTECWGVGGDRKTSHNKSRLLIMFDEENQDLAIATLDREATDIKVMFGRNQTSLLAGDVIMASICLPSDDFPAGEIIFNRKAHGLFIEILPGQR
jgi:hypothetical protein